MTSLVFPDIDGAERWYVAAKDGVLGLREAIRCGAKLSEDTFDELFGLTQAEWRAYYRQQSTRHEMFATLALFAACEGGIRRDFEWRSNGGFGQIHQERFRKIRQQVRKEHVALGSILDGWISAERSNAWLQKRMAGLAELFRQRNDLAHGRISGGVAFEPVYDRLCVIREKWRDAVDDFRGY
ncbi:MAG: hypothetical protein Q8L93_12705 [Rhodocyclaceae bacterium]|nr:hypothetical protein [Rhodocyclaceae bacterium]